MSDDIGAWYEARRQQALQLQGMLNAHLVCCVECTHRKPRCKQGKALAASLERARYVGD